MWRLFQLMPAREDLFLANYCILGFNSCKVFRALAAEVDLLLPQPLTTLLLQLL